MLVLVLAVLALVRNKEERTDRTGRPVPAAAAAAAAATTMMMTDDNPHNAGVKALEDLMLKNLVLSNRHQHPHLANAA